MKNEVPADSHERAVSGDILQDCRSVYGINGIYLVEVLGEFISAVISIFAAFKNAENSRAAARHTRSRSLMIFHNSFNAVQLGNVRDLFKAVKQFSADICGQSGADAFNDRIR